MDEDKKNKDKNDDDKWEFSDYAYLITGIIVALCLVIPDIIYSMFGISILGGSLGTLEDGLLKQFRTTSPLLFMLTTAIVFIVDAIEARKSGGYKGSMFTHTFETLVEDAIYMSISTILVYGTAFTDTMYASWLAGPITFVLFIFIFPMVRKKSAVTGEASTYNTGEDAIPWFLLLILIAGVIVEIITQAWIALPFSWLVICVFQLVYAIRERITTIDHVFDVLYYLFSIILMAVGLIINYWVTSWIAFPFALLICWILSKTGKYKTPKRENEE